MDDPKNKVLYMIGNAHLDPVWLWNWQEGFAQVKATFRSALDRMQEDPDFIFTSSSAQFYEWVEKNCPAMFEEIRGRIREGRWEIAGGWIVQPDCNLPCGESFARQSLYGQRYFREKLGVSASVGYCVDSFGHSGSLPQILQKSGMDSYVFMRPMPGEKGLPGRIFRWRGIDGSEVYCYRIPCEYLSGGGELEPYVRRLEPELAGEDALMLFYGVGNHGGGPTRENLKSIHVLNARKDLPTLKMHTVRSFFDAVKANGKEYPTHTGDLQHHASGCYSVCSRIKQENRRAENLLLAAERWSTVATALEKQPVENDFKEAWKGILFNQFHDILAGTSIPSAYDDASYLYGRAMAAAQQNLCYAQQAISWDIGIETDVRMKPIVVFNPHAFAARMPVELEVRGLCDDCFHLVDDAGNTVSAQRVQSEAAVEGQSRLLFVAELPGLGYRLYRLYAGEASVPATELASAEKNVLENGHFRLEMDSDSGCIRSLFDKKAGAGVFRGPGARPAVVEDEGDTWAHGIVRFEREKGEMQLESMRRIEHGPVRSTIRVRYRYGNSVLTEDFRIYRSLDWIEVSGRVDWQEPHALLKLHFPVAVQYERPVYGIPFGHISKAANGEEEPCQGWVDLSGELPDRRGYGLSICTDRTSCSMEHGDIALTLLRGSVYAHHEPKRLEEGAEYRPTEEGPQPFCFALLPHEGDWGPDTVECSRLIGQAACAVIETYHAGKQPSAASFLSSDRREIFITAFKEAEDGDGRIVRAYEATGKPVTCTLRVLDRGIVLHFGPNEIKTLKIPYDTKGEIRETNLLEDIQ